MADYVERINVIVGSAPFFATPDDETNRNAVFLTRDDIVPTRSDEDMEKRRRVEDSDESFYAGQNAYPGPKVPDVHVQHFDRECVGETHHARRYPSQRNAMVDVQTEGSPCFDLFASGADNLPSARYSDDPTRARTDPLADSNFD